MNRFNSKPKRVVLHCAATPDYIEGDEHFDRFGVKDVFNWHRQRGFSDVGYHFVIRRTGVIELGRPLEYMGAHAKGNNHDSIGVCYIGEKEPTKDQLKSLLNVYRVARQKYGIEFSDWFGHGELDHKKPYCPGFSMTLFRKLLEVYHHGLITGIEN